MISQIKTKMKSVVAGILAVSMMLPMFVINAGAEAETGLHVDGTSIVDSNGNAFEMRGVNIAHAWYTAYTQSSIKGAAKLGANTVRIVCANGAKWTKTSATELKNIIRWCINENVICVLELHDATGSDNTSDLDACVDYWIEMKDILNENTDYVVLNIANEWYGSWNGYSWAEGNKKAIKDLRNAGIKNMIMVDSAGWGQYPDSIKDYGKSVAEADTLSNTVFSIHMYEYAGGNATTVKTNIDNALATGSPVVIGEFGGQHTSGDVDELTIMSYCEEKGVGYLGWSWKGNSSDLSYLDISSDWEGNTLTTWGDTLFNDKNGIKNTSEICSVYNNSAGSEEETVIKNTTELFSGNAAGGAWEQATTVQTIKNDGGTLDPAIISKNGYFYVEYTGNMGSVELIMQSWSDGKEWARIAYSDSGIAENGNYYASFSYDDCVTGFETNDFATYLDAVHVGVKENSITVKYLAYVTETKGMSKPVLTAVSGDKCAELSWTAVDGADYYQIIRYKNGEYQLIASIKGTKATVKGLSNNFEYTYLIRAVGTESSTLSKAVRVTPASPLGLKAEPGDKKATLTWNSIDGAKYYQVIRYKAGKYSVIATVNGTSVTVMSLANNFEYTYIVKAVSDSGELLSDAVRVTPCPQLDKTVLTANAGDKKATLSWTAVDGAKYYQVIRYKDGEYTVIANVTGTSVVVKSLANNFDYTYILKAVGDNASSLSNAVKVTPTA